MRGATVESTCACRRLSAHCFDMSVDIREAITGGARRPGHLVRLAGSAYGQRAPNAISSWERGGLRQAV
jgi:hypothetical protein